MTLKYQCRIVSAAESLCMAFMDYTVEIFEVQKHIAHLIFSIRKWLINIFSLYIFGHFIYFWLKLFTNFEDVQMLKCDQNVRTSSLTSLPPKNGIFQIILEERLNTFFMELPTMDYILLLVCFQSSWLLIHALKDIS